MRMYARYVIAKVSISCVVIMETMLLVNCCYAEQGASPVAREHMERVKKAYGFEKWSDMVKIPSKSISRLPAGNTFFDKVSTETRIYTPGKYQKNGDCSINTGIF
jgi:hypothetical protein